MAAIMNLINNCFTAVSGWFIKVFNSSEMVPIYISCLFIYLAVKFIISPLFGISSASDYAKSERNFKRHQEFKSKYKSNSNQSRKGG